MTRLLPTLLLLAVSSVTAANVMYVDDKLVVMLRAGAGNNFRTISTVETGTRLEILETNGEYLLARDPKGNEGWIQSRYLTEQPVARDRLVQAEQKIAALEADKQKLREQMSGIDGERKDIKKERSQLEKDNQKLQQELAEVRESAANPLKLSNENRVMRDRLATLEEETQHLRTDNEKLQDDTARKWVLTGAGILGGGILIGLILPKLRRRRSSWGSDF